MNKNYGSKLSKNIGSSGRTGERSPRVNHDRNNSDHIQKRAVKNPVPGDGGKKK